MSDEAQDEALKALERAEKAGEALRKRMEVMYRETPKDQIVYLPRMLSCCTRNQPCKDHVLLRECANCHERNIASGHYDIKGIGHIYVQRLFNEVDPFWSWEPVGVDENGLPAIQKTMSSVKRGATQKVEQSNLWIKVTVCGVTRLGVGTDHSDAEDLYKKLVSDAIKNAGLRFGIAADLREDKQKLVPAREGGLPRTGGNAPRASEVKTIKPVTETETVKAEATVNADDVKRKQDVLRRIAAANTREELKLIGQEIMQVGNTLKADAEIKAAYKAKVEALPKPADKVSGKVAAALKAQEEEQSKKPVVEEDDDIELPTRKRTSRPHPA